MMGLLEDNFCDALSDWKAKNFTGTQADLGELFGVTQAQINRVLNKKRAGDEGWRRMVANKIGIPYDKMIGINGDSSQASIISLEDKDHLKVTVKFKKKDRAIRINEKLVYAEQLDEDSLDKIERQIDLELEDLEKRAGLKKRPAANGED